MYGHYKISQFYRWKNSVGVWLEVRRWFFYRRHHRRMYTDGLHPSAFLSSWFPLPSLYRSEKQKNHFPMVLQTEFARQKKKIPAWNIPTDFYSVGDIVIDRRKLTVGKSVGEGMKYRSNISVCKFVGTSGSYCLMPTD